MNEGREREPIVELVLDQPTALEKLRGFSQLQRRLLATAGTLQGALSALFGAPVTIEVLHQDETDRGLVREVDLVCTERRTVVCHAVTEAQITDPRIRQLVLERTLGLGQIAITLGRFPSFALEDVGRDFGVFWRAYRLWGDGFSYRIHEAFPARLYVDAQRG